MPTHAGRSRQTARAEARALRSQTLAAAAPVFTALGDETRLHLVTRLCREGPLSITALATGTELSRQGVTKHLAVLSKAGLARCSRRGREQLWQVEARRLKSARRLLLDISTQWDHAIERLRQFVEPPREAETPHAIANRPHVRV